MVCHNWFFNPGFKFQDFVCNCCKNMTVCVLILVTLLLSLLKMLIIFCMIYNISKSDTIHLLEISVLDDCRYILNACQRNQYPK